MKENIRISADGIESLIQMANDWVYAKMEKETFLGSHSHPLMRTDDYAFACGVIERESCTWSALCTTCRILGFDVGKVVATSKAMRRYEERGRWMVSAKIPADVERVIRFLRQDESCRLYNSTGRPLPEISIKEEELCLNL